MTWEIVVGIITLFGFIISLVSIIAKLVKIITKLDTTVASLEETVKELKKDSREEHAKMHARLDDHEKRIIVLEHPKHEGE